MPVRLPDSTLGHFGRTSEVEGAKAAGKPDAKPDAKPGDAPRSTGMGPTNVVFSNSATKAIDEKIERATSFSLLHFLDGSSDRGKTYKIENLADELKGNPDYRARHAIDLAEALPAKSDAIDLLESWARNFPTGKNSLSDDLKTYGRVADAMTKYGDKNDSIGIIMSYYTKVHDHPDYNSRISNEIKDAITSRGGGHNFLSAII